MWLTFYDTFILNSQCPRVRMTCYAIQCALDIGPVLRAVGSRVPTSCRELYLLGDLESGYNQLGLEKCVFPRILAAADFSKGLFTHAILKIVAIRIFKLLRSDDFPISYACCCSEVEGPGETRYNTLTCSGPKLDLSADPGQSHHMRKQNLERPPSDFRTHDLIRSYQSDLRDAISRRDFAFQDGVHYRLPGILYAAN